MSNPSEYAHSPIHLAVLLGDHAALTRLLSALPRLSDPARIRTESHSLREEALSARISSVLDRRDNPRRETPLHLAVRRRDLAAAAALSAAGADVSIQNAAGWNPLQEALLLRRGGGGGGDGGGVAETLMREQHRAAWGSWRRRMPRLVAGMRRMRDFYMEIGFRFESSFLPFVPKLAPSDTYRIWKRDGNLRADTSLAGFDGMKVQRADQSYFFFGDGEPSLSIPSGSLLILNRDEKKIFDAFENAGVPLSDADVAAFCNQTSVHRPGMDVTQAELVGRTNWRRQEKTESVGEWKAKVYEVNNVVFSYRSRKIITGDSDIAGSEQILPLELEEDAEEGFLVAENPRLSLSSDQRRRRHSSFVREERESVRLSRTSVDVPTFVLPTDHSSRPPPLTKEKEYVKTLKPSVWLTDQFPLKIDELLPLLDILANKVKAVRRMRELLTTKFPPGTFPVKLAIPVVPTVRVVITFTKFVELQPTEQFFTPFSSPRHLVENNDIEDEEEPDQSIYSRKSSSASSSVPLMTWHRRSSANKILQQQQHCPEALEPDPFAIPTGYSWSNFGEKTRKMRKSKSTRKR